MKLRLLNQSLGGRIESKNLQIKQHIVNAEMQEKNDEPTAKSPVRTFKKKGQAFFSQQNTIVKASDQKN